MVFATQITDVPWREHEGRISESGGTVGPLPDGTVIEVEPADWATIIDAGGLPAELIRAIKVDDAIGRMARELALAAYNARHASS
jgi:hypothetical protein